MDSRRQRTFHKIWPLLATTLLLPVLGRSEEFHQKFNDDRGSNRHEKHFFGFDWFLDREHSQGHHQDGNKGGIPAVPETNTAWVLVPFFGLVLLLSSRQLLRSKARS